MKPGIKLAMVDDHQIVIDGLTSLLKGNEQFEFVFATTNSSEVINQLENTGVDILLTDVMMPSLAGNKRRNRNRKSRNKKNRLRLQQYLLIGVASLMLLGGLLINSQYRRYKLRQETKLKTLLMQQQEFAVKAVIEAEENERQRIARELHDGVGQMMSAAKMNLSAFESEMQYASEEQKSSLQKAIQLVDDSCREVRTVSHIMMPNALLKNNLPAAINDFVHKLNNKSLQANVYTEGLDQRFDSNIETVLYRVIQECVNNAIRHAGATRLDISLVRDKEGISGTIEDNGKGFDSARKDESAGIGLKNIRTRIEFLKGTVEFDSAPGRGTLIALHIPNVKM